MGYSNICAYPGCSSPVWVDSDGNPSLCCSRKHMKALSDSGPSTPLCQNCNTRPVFVEHGKVHPFCSRKCANAYDQGPQMEPVQQDEGELCLLCGQSSKCVVDGKVSDFCSISCRETVYEAAPVLLEVPSTDEQFQEIADLFRAKWLHPPSKKKPYPGKVLKLYKVYSHGDHMRKFRAYKAQKHNARRRWHGTTRRCCLGDDEDSVNFCSDPGCAVCGILRNSFRVDKAKASSAMAAGGSFQRFGVGIYTSATSSKSYDYIKELGGSPYKAMILSEVVMGKVCKVTHEEQGLIRAPPGYDSVVGEPNITVNYDEAVVYTDHAIRPEYLLIFEPGV